MDLHDELVHGKGWAKFPIEDLPLFTTIREKFLERLTIAAEARRDIDAARAALPGLSNAELNQVKVALNSFDDLSRTMIDSCRSVVAALCDKKLFIQRRAQWNLNIPDDSAYSILGHYEMMGGVSPFSYVLWAPLHDIDDESGVFLVDQQRSVEIMEKEHAAGLVNGPSVFAISGIKPQRFKFGEALVFNPFVIHGNVTFESKFARLACNTRFQSMHKPLLQKNSDYMRTYTLS